MISTIPKLVIMGKALLLRGLAGERITFTRIKIGSGQLATGQAEDELDNLIHAELSVAISEVDTSQEGLVALTGDFNSEDIDEDFTWRELGVFAKGEDDIEHLFAYANDREAAGTLRKLATNILTEQTMTLIMEIGDVENITAIFSPHRQYAEAADLDDHTGNKSNPHGVTKAQVGLGNVPNLAPSNMTVTFTEAAEAANIATGEKLSAMFGKIKKIITSVLDHLANTSNPHGVTLAQVGGAAVTHTHGAGDIGSGTLPIARGGTGVGTLNELKSLIGTPAEMGVFTGDGTHKRLISLGFEPSAVILCNEYGQTFEPDKGVCGGIAAGATGLRVPASTNSADATTWSDTYTALMIGETGFYVNYNHGTDQADNVDTNELGVSYRYIAFR